MRLSTTASTSSPSPLMAPPSSRREAEHRACDPLLRRCRTVVRCCLPPGKTAPTRLIAGHVIQPCWCRLCVSTDRVRLSLGYEPHDADLRHLAWSLACCPAGGLSGLSPREPMRVLDVPLDSGGSRAQTGWWNAGWPRPFGARPSVVRACCRGQRPLLRRLVVGKWY